MMILAHLFGETVMRFSDLQRAIPNVSQKMLIQQLRGLEQDGVISRTVYPEVPPKVEYRLTDIGQGLGPVFLALLEWAELKRGREERTLPQRRSLVAPNSGEKESKTTLVFPTLRCTLGGDSAFSLSVAIGIL